MTNLKLLICLSLTTIRITLADERFIDDSTAMLVYSWRLTDATNDFAFNLHDQLALEMEKNLVFCPVAVANTLAILHFGAKGRTARELEYVQNFERSNLTRSSASLAYRYLLTKHLVSTKPKQYLFELANTIFVNKHLGLSPAYKNKVEEFYRSQVKAINFVPDGIKAVADVNDWVRNKTRGKIRRIIDDLDPTSDLVVASTAYFKAQWKYPFRSNDTSNRIFRNIGKKEKSVPTMEQVNTFFYAQNDYVSLVEVPFKGKNFSMVIFLPVQMEGLLQLEENMTHHIMFNYLGSMYPTKVHLHIPKFKISFSNDMVPYLQALGVRKMFQPTEANFTGMILNERVNIGEMKHKAVMDVNESGVETSPSNVVTSGTNSDLFTEPAVNFQADHPFMFVILDKRNGMILFMGRVWSL